MPKRLLLNKNLQDRVLARHAWAGRCPSNYGIEGMGCKENRSCIGCWAVAIAYVRINNGTNVSLEDWPDERVVEEHAPDTEC